VPEPEPEPEPDPEPGNAEAQINRGAMHIAGLGVRKQYDKALHYFTLSAHQVRVIT
jgi:TPR repeat protein